MAIKNKSTLQADNLNTFSSGKPGGIISGDERNYNTDIIDSNMNLAESAIQQMNGAIDMNGNNINNIGNSNAVFENVLLAFSVANSQTPLGLDQPLQIEFGAAQNGASDPVQIAANGEVTFNQTGSYRVRIVTQQGRIGGAGVSFLLSTLQINNAPVNFSIFARLDSANISFVQDSSIWFNFNAGDTIKAFIIRDSAGNNSGELQSFTPTLGSIPIARTAAITIDRIKVLS